MIYAKILVLITIEQLWYRHPNVIAPYTDDTAFIIDEECTISVSSILEVVSPPDVILTILQFRLYPLEASVCNIMYAFLTLT